MDLILNFRKEQFQLATTPAVNRLLYIANQKIRVPRGKGIFQQGLKTRPLKLRGVLKLIDQKVLVLVADFFIQERGFIFPSNLCQKIIHV